MAKGDYRAVFAVRVFEGGDAENGTEHFFTRGETIPGDLLGGDQLDRYLEIGAVVKDDSSDLPPANPTPPPTLTQPNGDPVGEIDEAAATSDFRKPRSHAEADAMAAEMGVTFPDGAKLDAKVEALQAVSDARANGEQTPATGPAAQDLDTLSDEELIQRGIDFGHAEEEMVELSHDELVLFVAEAQNRQTNTVEAQNALIGSGGNTADAEPPTPPTE